ncbi:MAG: 23S rRNA (pseudouridine(1915)-N(3))-methyltransferase RlmH [Planctomycetota bacterium]
MKITLLAVGRVRHAAWRELCADYLLRLRRYGPAEVQEVKAAEVATPVQAGAEESRRLLAALDPRDKVIVLDERGAQITSPDLATCLQEAELRSVKRLIFVLGGAFGVNDAVRNRGRLLALSKLTLPHELCRVLALEQLYRARTIQRGEPYHHA